MSVGEMEIWRNAFEEEKGNAEEKRIMREGGKEERKGEATMNRIREVSPQSERDGENVERTL